MARQPDDRALTVAKATADDLEAICEIEQISFPTPWSRQALADELDRPWSIFRVLKGRGGELLAYLNYWVVYDEVHVLNVATHPSHRRRGYARLLLGQMVLLARKNACREVQLEVRPSNLAARRLYESLGFAKVGVRPGYYPDSGEDALLYRLETGAPETNGGD
ncbi:MAG: ribosomal protein S18-alanine N-acetyltransferase [Polyangia bacterium]|mgnify:CR=1 FL=1|jgi:ribosomal-protein-alanine N-acetyltransferase|nr:ribosomal protein S18-alanine N-acetyltransferase [Polyangia bacterium]